MTDSTLTRDQAIALLRRLGTDDTFRTLFETKPAKALAEAGVPSDTITGLKASCLIPIKLAAKEELSAIVEKLQDADLHACMEMFIPTMRLPRG